MNQVPTKKLGHSWSIDLGLSGASNYFEALIKEVSLDMDHMDHIPTIIEIIIFFNVSLSLTFKKS